MALDLGEKYLGIALSDPTGRLAFPQGTVTRRGLGDDIDLLLKLAQEEGVGAIVVGLPLSLSGEVGPEAQRTLDFCQKLAQATSLPVETWDERLSTVAAQRRLVEGQSKPRRRVSGASMRRPSTGSGRRIDAVAAAIVLQSYLDAQAREGR